MKMHWHHMLSEILTKIVSIAFENITKTESFVIFAWCLERIKLGNKISDYIIIVKLRK